MNLGYSGQAQISFGPNHVMPMDVNVTLKTVIEMIPGVDMNIHHWTGDIVPPFPVPTNEFIKLLANHLADVVSIRLPTGQVGSAYIEYFAITTVPIELSFSPVQSFREYVPGKTHAVVRLIGAATPPYAID